MVINVLLVDDSTVIRKLLSAKLLQCNDINVVATAINGKDAIELTKHHQPHIIILDIEMPTMDGLSALPFLLEAAPKAKVIMASRLTHKNAKTSLEALALGASDYIPKPEIDDLEIFYKELIEKIRALAPRIREKTQPLNTTPELKSAPRTTTSNIKPPSSMPAIRPVSKQPIYALAIASSTGGPQALIKLFDNLGGALNHIPIFITQHMPATFTPIFAEHLTSVAKISCVEGKEGTVVKSGMIYLAPGNYHMTASKTKTEIMLHNNQDAMVNFCRPAADPMFTSLSDVYGVNLLALVLTGMGQDGRNGAEYIANNGGSVIAQDAASCVVYGMPKAVAESGVCQEILPLDKIASYLLKRCNAG